MASEGTSAARLVIQALLAVAIVALSWFLYHSIHTPWARYEAEQRETELVRTRMNDVRTALMAFSETNDRFPGALDSLVQFIRTDSAVRARGLDEVFLRDEDSEMPPVNVDSLPFSPRTGRRFEYAVNDTSALNIYWLADPDNPADSIGSHAPDPARRNAASWE